MKFCDNLFKEIIECGINCTSPHIVVGFCQIINYWLYLIPIICFFIGYFIGKKHKKD